jgi:hypothetical protein
MFVNRRVLENIQTVVDNGEDSRQYKKYKICCVTEFHYKKHNRTLLVYQ